MKNCKVKILIAILLLVFGCSHSRETVRNRNLVEAIQRIADNDSLRCDEKIFLIEGRLVIK